MADRIRNRIRSNVVVLAASLTVGVLALLTLAPAARAQMFSAPTNFAAGDSANSVAVGDFNADSDPDLAVANGDSDNVSVLLGGAGGDFSAPTNLAADDAPVSVAVGDFNVDADPDLAVANLNSGNVWVLLGGAGATFGGPTNIDAPDRTELGHGGRLQCGLRSRPRNRGQRLRGDPGAVWVAARRRGRKLRRSRPASSRATGPSRWRSATSMPTPTRTWRLPTASPTTCRCCSGTVRGASVRATDFAAGDEPVSVAVADFNGDADPDLAVANLISDNVSVRLGDAGRGDFGAASNYTAGVRARARSRSATSTPTPTPTWRSPTPAPTTSR